MLETAYGSLGLAPDELYTELVAAGDLADVKGWSLTQTFVSWSAFIRRYWLSSTA